MKRKIRMRQLVVSMLVIVLSLGLLSGCKGGKQEELSDEVRTVMNTRIWSELTTLDPTNCANATDLGILYNIYDSLFDPIDGDYDNLEPALAESYTVNESATYYEFKVRENVKWHNGDILDAEDCVFSIERMRSNPNTQARLSSIVDVEQIDEMTFSMTAAYPMPRLPALMSTAAMSIVNKDLIEKYGDNAIETAVGTGAYKLESWDTDKLVLTAFEDGWRGSPRIKTVNYLLITDTTAGSIAFANGEIDQWYVSSMDELDNFRDETKYLITPYTTGTTDSLVFNTSHTDSWVSNKTFRQAVAHAVDRESVLEIATDGLYQLTESVFAPGNGAYNEDWVYPYDYNPDKAEDLLAECGYDGAPVVLLYTSVYPIPTAWATTIEANLRAVGINVTMDGTDLAGAIERFVQRDYDMACLEYGASYPDPLSSIYALFRSDGYYNAWVYSTEEIDDKVISLYGIADVDEQAAAMQELDQWAQEEAFYVPNYQIGGYAVYPATLQSDRLPEPMFGWNRLIYSYWLSEAELAEMAETAATE